MDEMNVEAVDLGGELWHGVQPRLDLAPALGQRLWDDGNTERKKGREEERKKERKEERKKERKEERKKERKEGRERKKERKKERKMQGNFE